MRGASMRVRIGHVQEANRLTALKDIPRMAAAKIGKARHADKDKS